MTGVTEEPAPTAHPSLWFGLGRSARHDANMVENSFTSFLCRIDPDLALAGKNRLPAFSCPENQMPPNFPLAKCGRQPYKNST